MVSVADDLADSTVQVGQFNPRELYEYTVRDNLELRDRILDFLKVLMTTVYWFLVQSLCSESHLLLISGPVPPCRTIFSNRTTISRCWSSVS